MSMKIYGNSKINEKEHHLYSIYDREENHISSMESATNPLTRTGIPKECGNKLITSIWQ